MQWYSVISNGPCPHIAECGLDVAVLLQTVALKSVCFCTQKIQTALRWLVFFLKSDVQHYALYKMYWGTMTCACPIREFAADIAAPAKRSSPHHWKFSKAHTGLRFAYGFRLPHIYIYIKIMQAASRSHTKSWKCKCSQHWTRLTPTQEI
jgi:hypothetical protein